MSTAKAPAALSDRICEKVGPCALTFGPSKNRSDFFSELLATKNRSYALTQSEKKWDLHSNFFSELLTTKNRSVCAGLKKWRA